MSHCSDSRSPGTGVCLDNHGQPEALRLGSALSLSCLWASCDAGSFDWKDIGGIKLINK